MPEPRTSLVFTPPLVRKDYLVRHPAETWIAGLDQAFENACAASDFAAMSSVLNNLAFVLFKGGAVEEATTLCQSHYGGFVSAQRMEIALLAVQPWINEGRLFTKKRAFNEARKRLLPGLGLDRTGLTVAGRALYPVDRDTVDVCRNVALIDGFFLELAAGDLDAAEAHLAKFTNQPPGNGLLELRLQVALARNRDEEADALFDALCQTSLDPFRPATYLAAVAAARGDNVGFAKGLLLLVALLTDWAESIDEIASILHSILWLRRIDWNGFCAVVSDTTIEFLYAKAQELDDEELQALCVGRRYDLLPPGSRSRRLATELSAKARLRLASLLPSLTLAHFPPPLSLIGI